LWKQNSAARPIKYAVNGASANSSWYSRSMGLLGTLLLMFLIIHLSHFWYETKENTYAGIKAVFSKWYFVVIYLLGIISLFWHLIQGFQSAFQSLGINHKRYTPIIKCVGVAYSIIVCTLFALMPILMFFGVIN